VTGVTEVESEGDMAAASGSLAVAVFELMLATNVASAADPGSFFRD